MKTIFDRETRDVLIARVDSLEEASKPLWGKMNVFQMTRHCCIWNEWVLGKSDHKYKQDLLGKIFGRMALKSNTKDDRPIGKNLPAGIFVIKEKEGDFRIQKDILIDLISGYGSFSNDRFVHDFFGIMTKDQIGIFVYKHADHHLRQFGV